MDTESIVGLVMLGVAALGAVAVFGAKKTKNKIDDQVAAAFKSWAESEEAKKTVGGVVEKLTEKKDK